MLWVWCFVGHFSLSFDEYLICVHKKTIKNFKLDADSFVFDARF
jgi:hypothetical protein